MKNLKLCYELQSELELQSPDEVVRFAAFDIEQNRLFFASSANFIYTTHLPFTHVSSSSFDSVKEVFHLLYNLF